MRATWRGLLQPRRLLPILAICGPLVFAQRSFSARDPWAVPVAVVMCVVFVTLAPVSYRVLFPDGLDFGHGAVRLVLYGAVGAGAVLSVGAALPKLLQMGPTFLTNRATLVVNVAMFLVGGWGLGRDVGFEQRLTRLHREAERAQLLALRNHLDPHFLFNTLNAIAEWCRQDGATAEAAVLQLSSMLRDILDGIRADFWPLEKEVQLVRNLFALHQLRDPQFLNVVESMPPSIPHISVPPMSVLTLAENAIKHGHGGALRFEISVSGPRLRISLENPGQFLGPRAGSDGLPTLERHLALAYQGRASLTLSAAPNDSHRTLAVLELPS